MKKNLAEMHLWTIVEVLHRLVRELRRLGAGSADKLADVLNILFLSDGCFETAVAWAKAKSDDEESTYGSRDYTVYDNTICWADQYASCDCSLAGHKLDAAFNTCGGHGLRIIVTVPHYQVDGDIEVIADDLASERFWGDSEGDYLEEDGKASPQIVTNRESAFLKALAVDDIEFADREAERRVAEKEEFEKRRSEKAVRRCAAAKAAKATIEANKKAKAAMAAVFADDDEV